MRYYAPSIFNAYNICKRQAWLMTRNLNADQDNEYLEIGRLIDSSVFKREKKKIYLADIEAMLDMVSKKGENYYVAEIKKSSKTLESGIFQLKYYLFLLQYKKKISIKGIIKIPKEKISREIQLTKSDIEKIICILKEMNDVLNREQPPKPVRRRVCSKCAHNEFCWS